MQARPGGGRSLLEDAARSRDRRRGYGRSAADRCRARRRDMGAEDALLHVARAMIVMEVEAGLADADDLRMVASARRSWSAISAGVIGRLVRMDADRAPDVVIAPRRSRAPRRIRSSRVQIVSIVPTPAAAGARRSRHRAPPRNPGNRDGNGCRPASQRHAPRRSSRPPPRQSAGRCPPASAARVPGGKRCLGQGGEIARASAGTASWSSSFAPRRARRAAPGSRDAGSSRPAHRAPCAMRAGSVCGERPGRLLVDIAVGVADHPPDRLERAGGRPARRYAARTVPSSACAAVSSASSAARQAPGLGHARRRNCG